MELSLNRIVLSRDHLSNNINLESMNLITNKFRHPIKRLANFEKRSETIEATRAELLNRTVYIVYSAPVCVKAKLNRVISVLCEWQVYEGAARFYELVRSARFLGGILNNALYLLYTLYSIQGTLRARAHTHAQHSHDIININFNAFVL